MKLSHFVIATVLASHSFACKAHDETFEWAFSDFAGKSRVPVAMLVTALIDEKPCHMQLDTGMNSLVAWHEYSNSKKEVLPAVVSFAGHRVSVPASAAVRKLVSNCKPGAPVGSIGNELFQNGTLSVDFKQHRIAYQEGSALGAKQEGEPFIDSKNGASGHVLVEVEWGVEKAHAFLDTGSAALDLGVFDRQRWESLTGTSAKGKPVKTFKIHAWGKEYRCLIAPSVAKLLVGTKTIIDPSITYCPAIDIGNLSGLAGVVGMKSFAESRITIDYPARRWRVEDAEWRPTLSLRKCHEDCALVPLLILNESDNRLD